MLLLPVLLSKFEQLDTLRPDLVLVLELQLSRALLEDQGGGIRSVELYFLLWLVYFVCWSACSLLLPLLGQVPRLLRQHHFELLLQAGFANFFLFQLIFQRSNIPKGHNSIRINIILTGLPQIKVTFLPETFLALRLLQFLPCLL